MARGHKPGPDKERYEMGIEDEISKPGVGKSTLLFKNGMCITYKHIENLHVLYEVTINNGKGFEIMRGNFHEAVDDMRVHLFGLTSKVNETEYDDGDLSGMG